MNTTQFKHAAVALALLSSSSLMAQDSLSLKPFAGASAYKTWSIGVSAGALTPVIFTGKNDFTDWENSLGYGAYIKKQLWHSFGLRADFLAGKLLGNNNEPLGNGAMSGSSLSSFDTKLNWSASVSGELTLANINWLNRKSVIHPYATAGAGLANYTPTIVKKGSTASVVYSGDDKIRELYFPIGAGVKFSLSNAINLDLGYTANFLDGDNLDGYVSGPQGDKYSYGHIGLEFALGAKGKPQLASHNPVADMERDYVAKYDDLKNTMTSQLNAERQNSAALQASLAQQLADALKDSDGDGVIDKTDKCPGTPAGTKVDGSGCALEVNKPDTKIYITEEDRKVVRDAINNLEFDFGKATIREKSFASLNRVANLLIDKNFSLKLAGHTDNVGSDAANLKLSKDRAESVKAYLVNKGANPSRIEATGYGESQPIKTNSTATGRQANRRVEFTLY